MEKQKICADQIHVEVPPTPPKGGEKTKIPPFGGVGGLLNSPNFYPPREAVIPDRRPQTGSKPKAALTIITIAWLVLGLGLVTGCALDLRDQPRVEAFEESSFFEDHLSARAPVPGTVARGQLHLDEHLYTGRFNGAFATTFPLTVTMETLERGRERYDIFCSPCHGLAGDGQGIITEYGLSAPPSFHTPELRQEAPGYYFDIISRGTRVMPSYASRIRPEDRWAIIAYIRALQLSQDADLSEVPPEELPNLEE